MQTPIRPGSGRKIAIAGEDMSPLATVNARAALVAAAFLAQGLFVARQETAAFRTPVLFGGLALAAFVCRRGVGRFLACSAALGGLGMAVGAWLDGGHCAPGTLLSWTGGLMVVGCGAACALEPVAAPGRAMLAAHHLTVITGMLSGMRLPLLLERVGIASPAAGSHLAMLAGMTLGGWLALAATRALLRTRAAAAWRPNTG